MEQIDSIPHSISFSKFIAWLFLDLDKKSYTAVEIINKISELEGMGFIINDDDDKLHELSCCIESDSNWNFWLKNDLDYDSYLPGLRSEVRVIDFLRDYIDKETEKLILSFYEQRRELMQEDFCTFSDGIGDGDGGNIVKFCYIKKLVRNRREKDRNCNLYLEEVDLIKNAISS